jgi:hypothetical protein
MASKPRQPSRETFYDVLTAAINDLMEHGFDSSYRVEDWVRKLESAARSSLVPEGVLSREVRDVLMRTYQRTVDGGLLQKRHPHVAAYTIDRIKPKLRAELDRRILASASLIKLNREQSIQQTLQRFAGWATSIPIGGTEAEKRTEVKETIKRGIAGLSFVERRCIVDQGHKLVSSLSEIVALDQGAIAAAWRHVMEGGAYQARPEHVKLNNVVFVVRNKWAIEKGFMKLAGRKYTDEVEAPGMPVSCRCWWSWIYDLRSLPPDMVTHKGEEALFDARAHIAQLGA